MRWVVVLFIAVCIMVPIGFYIQAHGNFRGRAKLEPLAEMRYQFGAKIELQHPLSVCETQLLCAESRRMSLRLQQAELKGKAKDIQVAHDWYDMLKDQIKFAESVQVLIPGQNYTKVRILSGANAGYEGYVYTVALEQEAKRQGPNDPPPKHRVPASLEY